MDHRLLILGTVVVIVALCGFVGPAAAATDPQADGMVQDMLSAIQSKGTVSPSASTRILSITYWVAGEKTVIDSPGSSVTVNVPTLKFVLLRFKGIYKGPTGTVGYMLCWYNDGVFRKHGKIIPPRTPSAMAVDDFLEFIQPGDSRDVYFAISGPDSNPASTLTVVHFVPV